jgi:formimidoylglutamate deiminase
MESKVNAVWARSALLPSGFETDVRIDISSDGTISGVTTHVPPNDATVLSGVVLPGMPNVHSHAFQRAMAGLTEAGGPIADNFWSWRQVMYDFVGELSPDDVEAIAAQLYVELLRGGFTSVVEFHYLHKDPSGASYENPAEMSWRIMRAAEQAGITLTLLPCLIERADFLDEPLLPQQRRFGLNLAEFLDLFSSLRQAAKPTVRLGIAPHSLRMVDPWTLQKVANLCGELDKTAPIHIHVAEQSKEVDRCLYWCAQRPAEWLLDHVDLDERFCFIHTTHVLETELSALAQRGVVVGVCPTTEANLGDGVFKATEFVSYQGRLGIGTDSHVGTSALDELRFLEYNERLRHRRRNVLNPDGEGSTGTWLWQAAARGGAQAAGQHIGAIAKGCLADLVVLDPERPTLFGKTGAEALDAAMFGPDRDTVSEVLVRGDFRVQGHRHMQEEVIAARFRETMKRLLSHRHGKHAKRSVFPQG